MNAGDVQMIGEYDVEASRNGHDELVEPAVGVTAAAGAGSAGGGFALQPTAPNSSRPARATVVVIVLVTARS